MSGSLFFTFWKGGYLFKSFENRALINIYSTKGSAGEYRHAKENWIKGSALILTSHVAWSAWLILQAVVYKVYPASLSLNTLICFFACINPIFFSCAVFCKQSCNMEVGLECAAPDHYILWSCELSISLLPANLVAARKPDEGKGLAKGKVLETSINDYPLTNPDTSERK
ncbi:hypothetical protein Peur_060615 [Populus x canadensis]